MNDPDERLVRITNELSTPGGTPQQLLRFPLSGSGFAQCSSALSARWYALTPTYWYLWASAFDTNAQKIKSGSGID